MWDPALWDLPCVASVTGHRVAKARPRRRACGRLPALRGRVIRPCGAAPRLVDPSTCQWTSGRLPPRGAREHSAWQRARVRGGWSFLRSWAELPSEVESQLPVWSKRPTLRRLHRFVSMWTGKRSLGPHCARLLRPHGPRAGRSHSRNWSVAVCRPSCAPPHPLPLLPAPRLSPGTRNARRGRDQPASPAAGSTAGRDHDARGLLLVPPSAPSL